MCFLQSLEDFSEREASTADEEISKINMIITRASNVSDLGLELIYPRFSSFASPMEGTAHTNSISILSPIQQQQQQQHDNHHHQHRFPSSEAQGKEP